MEIKKLLKVSKEDLVSLGDFGYLSTQIYNVTRESSSNSFSFRVNLIDLETPYLKKEMNNEEDLFRYQSIVEMGYSFGVFVENELVAIAISEPQSWNNTLLLWHFQVHHEKRRRAYGKTLLNEIVSIAQANGFRAVTVETQNTNAAAILFYINNGFTIEGFDLSLYTKEAGKEEVAVYMRKKL